MVVSWIIQNLHTGNGFLGKIWGPQVNLPNPPQPRKKNKSSSLPLRFLKHAMIRGGVQDVCILQCLTGSLVVWKNVDGNLEQLSSTFQMFELVHGGDGLFGESDYTPKI